MRIKASKNGNEKPRSSASANNNGHAAPGGPRITINELIENALATRQDWLRRALDPRRDIDDECGFPKQISIRDYRDLYDRNPVAARVVEALPRECWQVTPRVYQDEEGKSEFDERLKTVGRGLRGPVGWLDDSEHNAFYEVLRRADEMCGLGSYGVVLLGLDDGLDLAQPAAGVEERNSAPRKRGEKIAGNAGRWSLTVNAAQERNLLYARVLDESLCQAVAFESNPTSPRYGHPTAYLATIDDSKEQLSGLGGSYGTRQVHWTRCVHLVDNPGSSELFGSPRMKPVFNNLYNLTKLYHGSAEMYWRGAFPGLALETHPQLGGDVELDKAGLRDEMEQYFNGLQRYLALMGMSAKTLAPTVVDPSPQIRVQIEAICIKLAIPIRVFLGSERGELASSQDDAAWNDRLRFRQKDFVTPRIIAPVVDRLIMLGVLPEPDGGYRVKWPDLDSQTDGERASVAAAQTNALAAYLAGQVEALVDPLDYLTRFIGLPREEAEQILKNAVGHMKDAYPDAEAVVAGHVPQPPQAAPPGEEGAEDGEPTDEDVASDGQGDDDERQEEAEGVP
jgi:hypothetical protein